MTQGGLILGSTSGPNRVLLLKALCACSHMAKTQNERACHPMANLRNDHKYNVV